MKEYDNVIVLFIQLYYLEVPSSGNASVAVSTLTFLRNTFTFNHFFGPRNRGVAWTSTNMSAGELCNNSIVSLGVLSCLHNF